MAELWRLVGWRRLVVTALCLVAWRGLQQIPLYGVSLAALNNRIDSLDGTGLWGALGPANPFVSQESVVVMGIDPYINALVVMTLLLGLSARMRSLDRSTLMRWTRVLAVALALGSAYGFTVLLQSDGSISPELTWYERLGFDIEMTAGTMILVLLAQVIDEHGLGFGNGAILIFALVPVVNELHRLADMFATAPAVSALYVPLALWMGASVAVSGVIVATVLAFRRIRGVRFRLLTAGVLRPQAFALALITLPTLVSLQLSAADPEFRNWILRNWTPYGPNGWFDAGYLLLWVSLIVAMCLLVVQVDLQGQAVRHRVRLRIVRLTLVGGSILALCCVVAPVLVAAATQAAGTRIAMSGYDTVLVVVIVLGVIMSVEGRVSERDQPLPVPRLA